MQTQNQVIESNTNATVAVSAQDRVQVAPASNAAASVGLTDTANAVSESKAVYGYEGIYKQIDQLVAEREMWEQGALRTSNEQLYALLAKCYSFYKEMCGKSATSLALRSGIASYIEKKGYRFAESTHNITKVVKCVFGVDRRRVSAYSLVLREALAKELAAEQIAGFIAAGGGVEEIRRSKSATAKTPKQKAELGKLAVSCNELAVVSSDKIAETLDLANVDSDLVAIVTQQADGTLIVRALVRSKAVLNAALACAYSANKAEVQVVASNKSAANDDAAQTDLITQAAA